MLRRLGGLAKRRDNPFAVGNTGRPAAPLVDSAAVGRGSPVGFQLHVRTADSNRRRAKEAASLRCLEIVDANDLDLRVRSRFGRDFARQPHCGLSVRASVEGTHLDAHGCKLPRVLRLCAALAVRVIVLVADVLEIDCGFADGVPGVPGDLEDDERDRQADDRIGDLRAERNDDRARDDAK